MPLTFSLLYHWEVQQLRQKKKDLMEKTPTQTNPFANEIALFSAPENATTTEKIPTSSHDDNSVDVDTVLVETCTSKDPVNLNPDYIEKDAFDFFTAVPLESAAVEAEKK